MKSIWELLRDTFNQWQQDNAPRFAAALTYYAIFSMAPILIIVLAVAGLVLGPEAAQGELYLQAQQLIGDSGAKVIQDLVENAARPGAGAIATGIGVVTIIIGASGLFTELQAALNAIWGIHTQPPQGLLGGALQLLRGRLLAFALVLGAGLLLLAAFVISTALSSFSAFFKGVWSEADIYIAQALTFVVTFLVTTLVFAVIYKALPDAFISWGDVWIGAAVTSLLFNIGRLLISLYLGINSVGSAYGAAGSLIALLVWVNFSAQLFLFGAEFTQMYANRYGSRIESTRYNRLPSTLPHPTPNDNT
ncbi:MAG: YihY/virulence factor BrkB family protein [Chloroflexi bacterium]|nr:YihY/virulence factor BrkB family protein [Chloroflexota bacterium]